MKTPKPRIDKTGQSYGHWIVKGLDIEKSQQEQKVYWLCECDCGCGTTKSIRGDALSQITVGGCSNVASYQSKICLKCGKEFFPKKQAKTRKYCYECVPEESYTNGATLRKNIKKWSLEYKGSKCQCCGYDKCSAALEFHHLDPTKKDFNISDRDIKLNWNEIKNELDKCIIVCSNCHKEIHNGIRTLGGDE